MADAAKFSRTVFVDDLDNPSRRSTAIFVLVCAVPMAATLLYGGVDSVSFGLVSMMTATILALWFVESWATGELLFTSNLLQLPIIGLILLGLVQLLPFGGAGIAPGTLSVEPSTALTLDPFATRLFVVRLVAYLIFFSAALAFLPVADRAKKLVVAIVIFGSVIAFVGILQRLADPEAIYGIRQPTQAIPFGPFINQHHFAAFMEMTAGLALGLLFGRGLKRDRKPFLMIAAALMSIGLVFTGSRGGVISFAGVIFFTVAASYWLRRDKTKAAEPKTKPARFALVVASVALALVVIGSVFYLGGGDSLLRGIGVQESYVDVSSGRIHFWGVALRIFAANPVLGAGLDSFGVAFSRFDTSNGLMRVEQAHNDYLQMLADGGIVGFACVAAFVILLFWKGLKAISAQRDEFHRSVTIGALAGCFGIAIHTFFDFPLRTPSNALFFLLLAALATAPMSSSRVLQVVDQVAPPDENRSV